MTSWAIVTASLSARNLAEALRVLSHWFRVFSASQRLRVSFLHGFLDDGDFLLGQVVQFVDEPVNLIVRAGNSPGEGSVLVLRPRRSPKPDLVIPDEITPCLRGKDVAYLR